MESIDIVFILLAAGITAGWFVSTDNCGRIMKKAENVINNTRNKFEMMLIAGGILTLVSGVYVLPLGSESIAPHVFIMIGSFATAMGISSILNKMRKKTVSNNHWDSK